MANTNIVRLTDAQSNQAAFVLYSAPVNSSQGLSIKFDFFAYGGGGGTFGGDGLGFFLIDGTTSPARAGGTGGSLGYSPSTDRPGLEGGYLGVGFDAFGNFSSALGGQIDGPGQAPNSVAVRGSANTGYKYLTGVTSPVSLSQPGAEATRESARRKAKVDLTATGLLSVGIDFNQDGDFIDVGEALISNYDVIGVGGNLNLQGQAALPATLKFGFAASTGGATNIHEVSDFKVTTSNGTVLAGDFTKDGLVVISGNTTVGSDGSDVLLVGGPANVIITGKGGADTFLFSSTSKAQTLRSSLVGRIDRITDFKFREGDRFKLDFDNNRGTVEKPRGLFNAGTVRGRNLGQAARSAYVDRNPNRRGRQALRSDEALFFRFGSRTYLSVNDDRSSFALGSDMVVDVTGIQFKPGDARRNSLAVNDYFA